MVPADFEARDNPHLSIDGFRETTQYAFPARAQKRKPLREDYGAHADALLDQLAAALGALPPADQDDRLRLPGLKPGSLVEIGTRPPPAASRVKATKVPATLEFSNQDILVLRTERRGDRAESAVLFVPDDARAFLRGRIADYGRDPGNARRPDVDRFEVVETISAPAPDVLFAVEVDLAAPAVTWWEVWVPRVGDRSERLRAVARANNLDIHPNRLLFPETEVHFVHSSAAALARFSGRLPGAISEIRPARGTIEPFLERAGVLGQAEWVEELAARTIAPADGAPVVCALDTGVASQHPLIAPGLSGAWAFDAAWGTDDHAPHGGHGTAMASLILYGDLEPHMNGGGDVELTHSAESVKLLPPQGFPAHQPPSYGVVTQGAVAVAEIERPDVVRSFCLATSTTDFPPSRPSSWSGALDQIAAGSMPGDLVEGLPAAERPKRLMLVATGNVLEGMKDDVLPSQPIEDPAQSWNALTIGGFTRKDHPPQPPPSLAPLVAANNRSPFGRGSQELPDDLTPIKPEVLFEAGNMVVDDAEFCGWHQAVSLLAAGSDFHAEPLVPFWATSAAVGVGGNFVGALQAALPDLWPETHRALTVDSASWPQPMRKRLVGRGAHWKTGSKAEKQQLLREFGYGVPDLERAIRSAKNEFTLVAQSEIQPFALGADGRSGVFNEMHFYSLPWPAAGLEQLENELVTMKVTLSYFTEPNLTGRAGTRPETYRSFGLRFAMKKRGETEAAFRARVNATQEGDDSAAERESSCWLLGPKAIQAGSLHCDLWRGYAIDLAGHGSIAVYPVGGWWKTHPGQRRMTDTARYALTISISAAGQAVDLYSEVSNLVQLNEIENLLGTR